MIQVTPSSLTFNLMNELVDSRFNVKKAQRVP